MFCRLFPLLFLVLLTPTLQIGISSFNSTQTIHSHSQIIDCDLSGDELLHNLDSVRMTETDSLFIIILAPFSFLAVIFVIVTSFYYPKLLESPGDIILALSINELLKLTTFLINAIYYLMYETGPLNNSSFCQLTGSILVVVQYVEDYYNIIFCLFILLRIRYLLKEVQIPPIIYHIFLVLFIITMVILLKYYGRIGKNYNGICGLKACFNVWAISTNFLQVLNIFLVTLTLKYFINNLPSYSNIKKIKAEIINYLGIYLIGQTVGRIAYEVLLIFLQINSYKWKSDSFRYFQFLLNFKLLITPLLLLIMRYNILFMAEIFKKMFFCRNFYLNFLSTRDPSNSLIPKNLSTNLNSKLESNTLPHMVNNLNSVSIKNDDKLSHANSFQYSEDQLNPRSKVNTGHSSAKEKGNKMSLEIEQAPFGIKRENTKNTKDRVRGSEKNEVGFFTINIISYSMKVMLTRSILTGIWISHTSEEEEEKNERNSHVQHHNNMFLETKRIPIHSNSNEEGKSLFELTMIIYAPRMFKNLLNFDKDMIDFDVSLDLIRNDENIKKANKSDGGKSGEFFFCTHDNKLIVKTLSSNELQIFLKYFEEYYNYLMKHKDSLITKIYGVYTFFRKDIDISNHVIIMRNIVNTSKKNIIVGYDLKGSTFDREVLKELKNYEDRDDAYSKKTTLKDSDFIKFEKNISIPNFLKERLLKNLEEDTGFFRKTGFMDYSLYLVKVHKERGIGLLAEMKQNPSNPLYSIESTSEPGVFYNIGIIDYFQKYTMKKFLEKFMKKIMHADYGLDTSSQDPKTYAVRFLNFMRTIVK